MGVAGSGKSTIAHALARHLGREFRDGDSFHSPANVAKMARGQPLTDRDRIPWLEDIAAWLAATPRGIVACSALRESYRDHLRVAGPLLFLHLEITPSTAHERVANRREHFMPASLVDAQYTALETPSPGESDVVRLDGEVPEPVLAARALSAVIGVPHALQQADAATSARTSQ
jgi:carbohydrate kinase (thermoresistant glucokinase family)